jgi:hypothetical protein
MTGKGKRKSPAGSFAELLQEFGDAASRILDDPEPKKRSKDFGESAVNAAKQFGGRFSDDEVRSKFRDA